METLFSVIKDVKSSHGHFCCWLFVTDNELIYAVTMKSSEEVIQSINQFENCILAPYYIMSDAAPEKKTQALQKFCAQMCTTLIVLEEGTPC